ncbi:MAG: TasA family protein [Candidatus Paceibacterota bacterium]
MKKIVTSLGMIVFAVALVASGTGAFFSDTETSAGNVFTAGAIDLLIDNSSYGFDWNNPAIPLDQATGVWGPNDSNSWELSDLTDQLFFNFRDLKPGDYGEDTISLHVNDNDAYACMAFDLTGTPENDQTEPEVDVDNTAGADEGELQNYLSFLFWHDDGDNVLEDDEKIIDALSGLSSEIFTGNWLALAESGDEPFSGGETAYIGKGWCFGDISPDAVPQDDYGAPTVDNTGFACTGAQGDHNDAQTDGIEVDVAFHAVQARHNDAFRCASLPPLDGGQEPRQLVGASLSDYVAPSCDVTVADDSQSIQDAVNSATPSDVVCVGDGSYDETVTIDKPLTLASVNGPTNTATIQNGVIIEADDVTLTGFVINPGSFLGTNAAVYLNGDLSNVEVSYNDIDGLSEASSRGVETVTAATYSNVDIVRNHIHDLTTGIYTNPHTGTIVIEYNDIDGNTAGIGGLNGVTVQYNEFEHTVPGSEAVGADSTHDANPATVQFNNFLDGTMLNTYGALAGNVNAINNFWGPNGGAAQTGGTDEVDFIPEEVSAFPHN